MQTLFIYCDIIDYQYVRVEIRENSFPPKKSINKSSNIDKITIPIPSDVFTGPLAPINISPSTSGMEMFSFDLSAKDGGPVQKIVEKLNQNIFDEFYSKSIQVLTAKFNESTMELSFESAEGFQIFIKDVDQNHISVNDSIHLFK
ncbi:unnamed protein product [Brachionus calyciflorus]|uniref:Uncharacterized protein n=1 Tax=Brachionus calyciflorus TaxID=104777 RepID=A0A814SYB5_9BILA|nr:unnamed protein product [Brachionus calyciflorus]